MSDFFAEIGAYPWPPRMAAFVNRMPLLITQVDRDYEHLHRKDRPLSTRLPYEVYEVERCNNAGPTEAWVKTVFV